MSMALRGDDLLLQSKWSTGMATGEEHRRESHLVQPSSESCHASNSVEGRSSPKSEAREDEEEEESKSVEKKVRKRKRGSKRPKKKKDRDPKEIHGATAVEDEQQVEEAVQIHRTTPSIAPTFYTPWKQATPNAISLEPTSSPFSPLGVLVGDSIPAPVARLAQWVTPELDMVVEESKVSSRTESPEPTLHPLRNDWPVPPISLSRRNSIYLESQLSPLSGFNDGESWYENESEQSSMERVPTAGRSGAASEPSTPLFTPQTLLREELEYGISQGITPHTWTDQDELLNRHKGVSGGGRRRASSDTFGLTESNLEWRLECMRLQQRLEEEEQNEIVSSIHTPIVAPSNDAEVKGNESDEEMAELKASMQDDEMHTLYKNCNRLYLSRKSRSLCFDSEDELADELQQDQAGQQGLGLELGAGEGDEHICGKESTHIRESPMSNNAVPPSLQALRLRLAAARALEMQRLGFQEVDKGATASSSEATKRKKTSGGSGARWAATKRKGLAKPWSTKGTSSTGCEDESTAGTETTIAESEGSKGKEKAT